jgi:hypothetical protein
VGEPSALAAKDARILTEDWLEPGRLAKLLALQRTLGWTAAQVLQQLSGCLLSPGPQRLAGRLLYLGQLGLAHLVVANRREVLGAWRKQHGLPANEAVQGEPQLMLVTEVATMSDANFASLPALFSSQAVAVHS